MECVTGFPFWPFDPHPEDVRIEDIAHSLAMQCRFAGHTKAFYSVAEHCWHVSRLCAPQDALAGLLHDAAEAYLLDLPRPIKYDAKMQPYRDAEAVVQRTIYAAFGLPPKTPVTVKEADRALAGLEIRELMTNRGAWWNGPIAGAEIRCWDPPQAKAMFLHRFAELTDAG
ncbi:phosphohydrolase [bacterium]|nr:MAG: phosphohydrolase [bacterium]